MKKTSILLVAAMLFFGGLAKAQYLDIGTGISLERGTPFNPYYLHSVSQMIYTPEDMGNQPLTIHALAWHQYVSSPAPAQRFHMKIYITMSSKSSFSSATDWNNNGDGGTLYYDGVFYVSDRNEWTYLTLDSPFLYNGTSNIVITVITNADNNVDIEDLVTYHNFICSSTSDYRCLYDYDNYTYYTNGFGNVEGARSFDRPNIRFFTTGSSVTQLPYIEVGTGTSSQSTSTHLPTATEYKHSISEQLFTNAELGGDGTVLYGVQFYQTDQSSRDYHNMKVYLSSTAATEYSSTTAWTWVVGSELCYAGGHIFNEDAGWNTFWFNEPKTILGGYNYALITVDSNENWALRHTFASHTPSGNTTLYQYSDATPYDAIDLPNSTTEGYLIAKRNNVRFITTPMTCSISGPASGQTGQTLTFTASSPEGASYSWNFAGGTPATATGTSASTTWNTAGTYTVTLTATRGNQTATATKNVTITNGVGIEEINAGDVAIYPNPTTGILNIEAEGLQHTELMDITGRNILTTTDNTIDLSNLSTGVYMIRVQTEQGTTVRRVVRK